MILPDILVSKKKRVSLKNEGAENLRYGHFSTGTCGIKGNHFYNFLFPRLVRAC